MRLLVKDGYYFASGMFWQIADEGRRSPNLSKLVKDTKHDLYCQLKSFRTTWGFCKKDELNGVKQVASLGKYIITASDLLNKSDNLIIVYKFKNKGELDEFDLPLVEDLYGYIILLNGTICPDDGEYVSNFDSIYESIIQQTNRYEIDYLYLTSDVAIRFFTIYELIIDNINRVDVLLKIFDNVASNHFNQLSDLFITNHNKKYLSLLDEFSHELLIQLVKEPFFEAEYKRTKDTTLRFMINNIYTLNFTSDEAYWSEERLKSHYKQSLLKSLNRHNASIYKLLLLAILFSGLFYLIYITFIEEEEEVLFIMPPQEIPVVMAVNPIQLINKCIINNDKYFIDLESWRLTNMKCDSLSVTLVFEAQTKQTYNDFIALLGESQNAQNILFTNQKGEYKIKYWIKNKFIINSQVLAHGQILTNLEQAANDYSFNLQVQNNTNQVREGFMITSSLSPVFLLEHHILDDVLLKEIQMSLNQNDGLYTWIINGEFK